MRGRRLGSWVLCREACGIRKDNVYPRALRNDVSSSYRRVQFMECEGWAGDGRSRREEESPNNLAALGRRGNPRGRETLYGVRRQFPHSGSQKLD